ncbi:ankyrin 2,3 unc44 protein [Rutstroemia sp. NJR-2017a WRK4]|nr:ankyrin 2,3 unc44 protein [Rutstroemia sp. NJR-2017a WRK4]
MEFKKLSTRELVAYNDAELDKFLERGIGDFDVEDPEVLIKDLHFAQRLRSRIEARSKPVDAKSLTRRLRTIPADRPVWPRQLSPESRRTPPPIGEEEEEEVDLEEEKAIYNTLVEEGGRPSHPFSIARSIIENPGEYREIAEYWHDNVLSWRVLGLQLDNWRAFRGWQVRNRGDGRFKKYAEDVRKGLVAHGFTRSFKLEEDPARQDKLTTWFEYLDYEYWWYDKDVRVVERYQQQYDEAWKELKSHHLKPSETEELIWDPGYCLELMYTLRNAEGGVAEAESRVKWAEKRTLEWVYCVEDSLQKVQEAKLSLVEAQQEFDSMKLRDDEIRLFKNKYWKFHLAKQGAARRTKLLRWILQQIPLIEEEMGLTKITTPSSGAESSENRVPKRRRSDEDDNEREPKRSRQEIKIPDSSTNVCNGPENAMHLEEDLQDRANEEQDAAATAATPTSTLVESSQTLIPATRHSKGSNRNSTVSVSSHAYSATRTRSAAKKAEEHGARKKRNSRRTKRADDESAPSRPLRRSIRIRKAPERYQ